MNRRKLIGAIIGIILFGITVTSLSYAYYAWQSSNTDITFNINDSYFQCDTNIDSSISSGGLAPVTSYKYGVVERFHVNNIAKGDTTFSLSMNINSISNILISEDFKFVLMVDKSNGSNNCTTSSNCEQVATGDFSNVKVGLNTLVPSISLPNNSRYEYYLFMYIDGSVQNSEALQNASMSSTLGVCDIFALFDTTEGNTTITTSYKKVVYNEPFGVLPTTTGINEKGINYKITRNDAVVTYNYNGATGGNSVASDTVTFPSVAGWYKTYTKNNGTYSNEVTTTTNVSDKTNFTLYPKWNRSCQTQNPTTCSSGRLTLPTPTRTGYAFGGWYLDSSFTIPATGTTLSNSEDAYYSSNYYYPQKTHNLYAKWTANKYSISTVANGGTLTASKSNNISYDEVFNVKATKKVTVTGNANGTGATIGSATNSNQTFAGWTSTSGLSTSTAKYGNTNNPTTSWTDGSTNTTPYETTYFKNLSTTNNGSVNLTANWTPVAIILPTLSKPGHTCKWYDAATGGNEMGAGGASWTPSATSPASVTAYARCTANTYTITYYQGNGTSTAGVTSKSTSTCTYGQSCTLKTYANVGATFPLSTNLWSFNGWSTSQTGTTVTYQDGATFTYNTASNLNIYAVGRRTFTFSSGKAPTTNSGAKYQYWNPYSTSTNYVTTVEVPNATSITGWTFIGYRATNDASSTVVIAPSYAGKSTYKPEPNGLTSLDFRSIYSRNVTLNYNANGGTGTVDSQTTTQYYNSGYGNGSANSGANVSTPSFTLETNSFSKTGYTFSKWAAGSTTGTQYSEGATYTGFKPAVDNTTTTQIMYAIWNANTYTVKYATGNNNCSLNSTTYANKTMTYDTDLNIANPTCTGYTFTGWTSNTSAGLGSNAKTGTSANPSTAWTGSSTKNTYFKNLRDTSGDVTLTANWTGNSYSIKFNANGGSGSMSNLSMTYGTAKNLTANSFTRTGYTFAGWSSVNSTKAIINDPTEYTGSGTSTGYTTVKQYTITAPFASGEVYRMEVDAKGSGTLSNFFYGATNYLRVASWTNSNGSSGTNTDGNNTIPISSEYTHYTVTFTLSSTGDTSVNKYLLFRAQSGCTATIKNIKFYKLSSTSEKTFIDKQNVNNLATSGTYNLYAIWMPNTYKINLNNQSATTAGTTEAWYQYNTTKPIGSINTCYYYTDQALTTCLSNGYKITAPTKTGYTFGGYYTSTDGGGTQYINTEDPPYFINNIYQKVPSQINSSYTDTITLYAKWTINNYTLTYDFNTINNMYIWNNTHKDRFNISYDSTSKMSTLAVTGGSGWEIVSVPITTVANKSYTIKFDYINPNGYTPYSTYSGIGIQALTAISNNDNSSNSLKTEYLSTTQNTTAQTITFQFTATGTTTYLAFNFGMAADGATTTIKLGNFKIEDTVQYNASISNIPNLTLTGYTFNGYYTSVSGGTKLTTSTKMPASNTTYYAQYSTNSYTVKYASTTACPLNATTYAQQTVNYDTDINKANPTCTGYTFTGWTASGDINTSVAKYGTAANPTTAWVNGNKGTYFRNLTATNGGTVTLTAGWTKNSYTITIKAGNGIDKVNGTGWTNTGTATMTKSVEYGSVLTLCGSTVSASTITVNNKTNYTGCASVKTSGSGTLSSNSFTVGAGVATITLNATTLGAPIPSISTSDVSKIYNSSDTTLTAIQSISYASGITVYYKFGSSDSASGTYTYGSAQTGTTTTVAKNSHFGTKYYKVQAYATDGTLTSTTATWSGNMSVTYTNPPITLNANSCGTIGTGTNPFYAKYGTANKYTTNTGTTAATFPSFTVKTGYTFNGWYTATSGGSKVLNADGSIAGAVTNYTTASAWAAIEAKTLYAQCTINSYTVTFAPNGGTMNSSTSTTTYTQNYGTTITMNNPTRTGYEFMGWVSNQKSNVTTAGYWTYSDSKNPLNGNNLEYINADNHHLNGYAGGKALTATPTSVSGSYTPSGYATCSGTSKSYTTSDPNPLSGISATNYWSITRTSYNNASYSCGPSSTLAPFIDRNTTVTYVIVARFPTGWSINMTGNSGVGTWKWLSSQTGTGSWATYVVSVNTNATGPLMNAGHTFLTNTSSSNTTHPTMDVAYFQAYYTNIQSSTASVNKFKVGAINETLTAVWRAVDQTVKITPNNANGKFTITATNLFDKTDAITSGEKLVQRSSPAWNGASYATTDSTHTLSGWIRVVPGATYKITGATESGLVEWSARSGKSYTNYYYETSTQATAYTNNTTFTAPTTYTTTSGTSANVTYIYMRIQAKTSDINNITLSMTASNEYTTTQTLYFPNNASISLVATPNTGYTSTVAKSSGLGTFSTSKTGDVSTATLNNIAGAATTTNLTVTWSAKSYTLTYDCETNGGTANSTQNYNYGASVDLTKTCTKTGWTHVGWAENSTATSKLDSFYMPANNKTLFAIYKKDVNMTFKKNGASTQTNASGNAVSDESVTRTCSIWNSNTTCSITSPTIVAASGFNVIGYNTAANDTAGAALTTSSWGSNESKSVSANAIYYAVTKSNSQYTATFTIQDTAAATQSGGNTSCYRYNGSSSCSITAPTLTANAGYTVVGWKLNGTQSSTDYDLASGGTTSISSNVTYKSITKKNAITYTATFYYNTNTVNGSLTIPSPLTTDTCTISAVYNGNTQDTSCSVNIPAAIKTSVGKYNGAYRGLASSLNSMATSGGASSSATTVSLSSNKTLYAIYSKQLTVVYPTSASEVSSSSNLDIYRNEYFTSTSDMTGMISAAQDNTTEIASLTISGIYGTLKGLTDTINSSTYKAFGSGSGKVSSTYGPSTATTLYAVVTSKVSGRFYYNTGSALTSTNATCDKPYYVKTVPTNMAKDELDVGDWVSYTPTTASFTTSTTYTGADSTDTIYPNELTRWRVIRKNDDGTVDVISQDVSSTYVTFKGETGYRNFVYYLNTLASKYANSTYTSGSRHFGYSNQTPQITTTNAPHNDYFSNPAPWTCSTGDTGCNVEEDKGGGDTGYQTDFNLLQTALGTRVAYKVNATTTATSYWMATRKFYYSNSSSYGWRRTFIGTNGAIDNSHYLYYYDGSAMAEGYGENSLRPILTLKANIGVSGSGTEADPYTLSAAGTTASSTCNFTVPSDVTSNKTINGQLYTYKGVRSFAQSNVTDIKSCDTAATLGKYVTMKPNTSGSISISKSQSGYTSNQTITPSTDILNNKWRVIFKNSNYAQMIADSTTNTFINFGSDGAANYLSVLNNIGSKYVNTSFAYQITDKNFHHNYGYSTSDQSKVTNAYGSLIANNNAGYWRYYRSGTTLGIVNSSGTETTVSLTNGYQGHKLRPITSIKAGLLCLGNGTNSYPYSLNTYPTNEIQETNIVSSLYLTYMAEYESTITLTYNTNGATNGTNGTSNFTQTATASMNSLGAKSGGQFTMSSNVYYKDGYISNAWNSSADGSGSTYNFGSKYNFYKNTTVYAKWTDANLTATFKYNNGGTVSTATATCLATSASGCTVNIPSEVLNSTGKYGGSYIGLSGSTSSMSTSNGASSNATTITINNNKTFYTLYSKQLTVVYPTSATSASSSDSLAIYRNEYFSSTTATTAKIAASNNTTTVISSLTIPDLFGTFKGLSSSSGTDTYKAISSVSSSYALSDVSTLYAVVTNPVSGTFYYYNGTAQTSTTDSCDQPYYVNTASLANNVNVGSYITYTPSITSFTTDSNYTGSTSGNATITPNELNKWVVIRKNTDGSVDAVSLNTSSQSLYFSGLTGYKNYVSYLNLLASKYENSTYTSGSRHFGYSNQIPTITDLTKFSLVPPWTCATGGTCSPAPQSYESQGGGDTGYETDYDLVNTALGTLVATKPNNSASNYFMASRIYNYYSDTDFHWDTRVINTSGALQANYVYSYYNGEYYDDNSFNSLRPIVVFKGSLKTNGGSGTSSSPYTLTSNSNYLSVGSGTCTYTVPTEVSSSTGPSSASYKGVSTSTSSTATTSTVNSTYDKYYAVYGGSFTATFTKENSNVSSIGSTSQSCNSNYTSNGTSYSGSTCSVTLPTITPASGYVVDGWYNSGTKVGDPGDSITLTANATYTAKAKILYAEEFSYDNSQTGEDCDDVQCMIDSLDALAYNVDLGDYISMTPTSTSYTIDTSKTGYTGTSQANLNPRELNLWRVIRKNADGSVDVISDKVSSIDVYFKGETGYRNFVGYLNTLASQYENSTYTTGSRYFGYNGQTEYITEANAPAATYFSATPPWACNTGESCNPVESKGGGDTLYQTDVNLVQTALGTRVAYKAGTSTSIRYWVASRYYSFEDDDYYGWSGGLVQSNGSFSTTGCLYLNEFGDIVEWDDKYALRPIVTLKYNLKISGGTGASESSPYTLAAR